MLSYLLYVLSLLLSSGKKRDIISLKKPKFVKPKHLSLENMSTKMCVLTKVKVRTLQPGGLQPSLPLSLGFFLIMTTNNIETRCVFKIDATGWMVLTVLLFIYFGQID